MGAGHAHALYVHEHSVVHAMSPQSKLVALFAFVVAAALTPPEAVGAFALYGLAVLGVRWVARVPVRFLLVRLVAIVPFVAFALFLPFIGSGDRVDVVGLSLSIDGLWAAWGILAKAVLGASAGILLVATTEVPEVLRGLAVLRFPAPLVAIAGFMVRYLEVIAGELSRMRTAMAARGYAPRGLWDVKPIAASAGSLFVRSYERGERVHGAMLARGYAGTMPMLGSAGDDRADWLRAGALAVGAIVVLAAALVLT